MEIVDIIGTGESAILYDWSSKNSKWSTVSAFPRYQSNVDLYFGLHYDDPEAYDIGSNNCLYLSDYPIEEIKKKYNSNYFGCSIAYMIAFAMYSGVKEIGIYGIDMTIGSEYEYERSTVLYWIGRAESEGIKVNTELNEINFMYGYEQKTLNKLVKIIDYKIKNAIYKIENTEGDLKHQWVGRMHALKEVKNILRS